MTSNQKDIQQLPEYTIELPMEPYLKQWVINEFGGAAVSFPKNSVENHILEIFLIRKPHFTRRDEPSDDTLTILLPYFKYKDVRQFNYLPNSGMYALHKCIRSRFIINLWNDLHTFGHIGKMKQDIIWAWMESHGIEMTDTNWNTIDKLYMRKRQVYLVQVWREKQKKVKKSQLEPPKNEQC